MAIAKAEASLRTVDRGLAGPARTGRLSSHLSGHNLKALDVIISPTAYPKGAVLFLEGQPAHGIFAVCSGHVKLSTCSAEGKTIILKIAEAGELIGLPATLSGTPYEVTAEVLVPARVNFIPRASFLGFLRANGEVVVEIAQLMALSYFEGHRRIQSLGHPRTSSTRLARFFIDWSARHANGRDRLQVSLTHQEIGEMIGFSRETVTRQLAVLKNRNLLTIKGATYTIQNRAALQSMAQI